MMARNLLVRKDMLATFDDDQIIASSVDDFPGTFSVILSTATKDRDGDELTPDGWVLPLPESIQFDSDHSMTVESTVGSGVPFINEAGQLIVNGTYATTQHAQNVRELVNGKHIRNLSVAYREVEVDGKKMRELINGSFVVVPANPEAKVLASKGSHAQEGVTMSNVTPNDLAKRAAMVKRRKALQRLAETKALPTGLALAPERLVQGIHDAAYQLGAGCLHMDDTGSFDGDPFIGMDGWDFTGGDYGAGQGSSGMTGNKSTTVTITGADDDAALTVTTVDADGKNQEVFSVPLKSIGLERVSQECTADTTSDAAPAGTADDAAPAVIDLASRRAKWFARETKDIGAEQE